MAAMSFGDGPWVTIRGAQVRASRVEVTGPRERYAGSFGLGRFGLGRYETALPEAVVTIPFDGSTQPLSDLLGAQVTFAMGASEVRGVVTETRYGAERGGAYSAALTVRELRATLPARIPDGFVGTVTQLDAPLPDEPPVDVRRLDEARARLSAPTRARKEPGRPITVPLSMPPRPAAQSPDDGLRGMAGATNVRYVEATPETAEPPVATEPAPRPLRCPDRLARALACLDDVRGAAAEVDVAALVEALHSHDLWPWDVDGDGALRWWCSGCGGSGNLGNNARPWRCVACGYVDPGAPRESVGPGHVRSPSSRERVVALASLDPVAVARAQWLAEDALRRRQEIAGVPHEERTSRVIWRVGDVAELIEHRAPWTIEGAAAELYDLGFALDRADVGRGDVVLVAPALDGAP